MGEATVLLSMNYGVSPHSIGVRFVRRCAALSGTRISNFCVSEAGQVLAFSVRTYARARASLGNVILAGRLLSSRQGFEGGWQEGCGEAEGCGQGPLQGSHVQRRADRHHG